MNTKTSAVNAVPVAVENAPRAARKPSMNLLQRFTLMEFVKNADPSTPDSALAIMATTTLGREVLQATVSAYRNSFGLSSVRKPTAGQLVAYTQVLRGQLLAAGIEPAPMSLAVQEYGQNPSPVSDATLAPV